VTGTLVVSEFPHDTQAELHCAVGGQAANNVVHMFVGTKRMNAHLHAASKVGPAMMPRVT